MNKKKGLIPLGLVLVSAFFLLIALSSVADQGAELQFETMRAFSLSNPERANYVIRSEADWGGLWNRTRSDILPMPPTPRVDFGNDMIIAVFSGIKNTGGFSITITRITETKGTIKVFFEETSPGPSCVVTQALTSPYHIARIRKSVKAVEFAAKQIVNEC